MRMGVSCKNSVQSVICMTYTWHKEHRLGICRIIQRQSSNSGYALGDLTVKQALPFLVTVASNRNTFTISQAQGLARQRQDGNDFENFKIPHEKQRQADLRGTGSSLKRSAG